MWRYHQVLVAAVERLLRLFRGVVLLKVLPLPRLEVVHQVAVYVLADALLQVELGTRLCLGGRAGYLELRLSEAVVVLENARLLHTAIR